MTFPSSMTRRALVCAVLATTSVWAQAQSIVMSSTTSTEQSGLFAHLLPAFKKASGLDVKVVALGTGQALDMGRGGDADVVVVHDQVAEDKFVGDGIDWVHFDTFAWRPFPKPGRPRGGTAYGLRAAWHMLKSRYTG